LCFVRLDLELFMVHTFRDKKVVGVVFVRFRAPASAANYVPMAEFKLIWTALVAARQGLPKRAETMLYCNVQVVV
jgi:hypothetical protein